MMSICLLIFKSSSPFTSHSEIVPSPSITIGISVNFMFHSFFLVLLQILGAYLSFGFFYFYSVVCRDG